MNDRLRGEEGVAMAMSLAFLSLFGVFTGVLLGFSETGVRSTLSFRAQTQEIYAAEGAVDGAINEMRDDPTAGRDPAMGVASNCPDQTYTAGSRTATAQCTPRGGSGGAPNGGFMPDHGILTLSKHPGEHGIHQVSDLSLTVNGSVFSNTDILNEGEAAIFGATGNIDAVGDCVAPSKLASFHSTGGAVRCANTGGGADPDDGQDPDFSPATLSVPAWREAPGCSEDGSPVEMLPGLYDDASALSKLTDGSCNGTVLHLLPEEDGSVGSFYFDFRNEGSHEWVIDDPTVNVVGGTKDGWLQVPLLNRPLIPFPGACDRDDAGVQLLFGSDSRVRLTDGVVELCPQPSSAGQEISIYGIKAGAATPRIVSPAASDHTTAGTVLNPTNAYKIQGAAGPVNAELTTHLGSFNATLGIGGEIDIPQGSFVRSVRLRVAHRESVIGQSLTVGGIVGVGSSQANYSMIASPVYSDTWVNIPISGSIGGRQVWAASFSVTGLTPSVAHLDGLELEINYEAPAFRAQDGCVIEAPYVAGEPATCAVLFARGAPSLSIHGSVYTPAAPIDVEILNANTSIFGRGIISRLVRLGVSPLGGYSGTTVGTIRADRQVTFTATAGDTTITVTVTFEDEGGISPGRRVRIDSWKVDR